MSQTPAPKLIHVEFAYADGRIERLTGDKANEWLEAVNGQCLLGQVHGVPMKQFRWDITPQPSEAGARHVIELAQLLQKMTEAAYRHDWDEVDRLEKEIKNLKKEYQNG